MSVQRTINFTFLVCAGLVSAFIAVEYAFPFTKALTAVPNQSAALKQLTFGSRAALHPTFSPDDNSIAFESNRDGTSHIYLMRADGTHQRALTTGPNDDRHPAWTPDGKSVLYDSTDSAHQDIWIVSITDGARKQLTHVDGFAEYAAMSPDGEQIAFYLYKNMTLDVWCARADGTDARPLTHTLADAYRNEPTMAWSRPAWSPDSEFIAYTGGDGKSIWLTRADGTDSRPIVADGETNHFPWFLPDGHLAYITEYVPPKYGAAWTDLWLYDIGNGKRKLMYEFMSLQEPLAWNADLSKLLFASPRNGNFDIYQIDLSAPGGFAALRGSLNIIDAKSKSVSSPD